ncbi:MAG: YdbL family protein [Desulfobacteraceae bacterium]|nr:YdbL family protein [Desulfobacteraceae bacterium]
MKKTVIAVMILMCSCTLAQVKVEVLSERTALENQVLGTYNSLDNEMLLVASVRGVDSDGRIRKPQQHSQEYKDTMTSMQILAFHADDIQAFKQLGWTGENKQGLLTTFPMKKKGVSEGLEEFAARYKQEEFNAVISQVNQAREAIMRRVIDMNENLAENNLQEVRSIFWKLNIENALPGEKIQAQDNKWTVKQ